jgi:hypothetical protein
LPNRGFFWGFLGVFLILAGLPLTLKNNSSNKCFY